MLTEVLPHATIVSIGHRATLIALHRRHIEMEPGEGGIFEPTPRTGVASFASAQP
jgi:vitamin B12/bleomycin/antimicrobial peptide transport system ATP-binding/permease protein